MKRILIVVPELSYSGSVYSSKRIAIVLKRHDFLVDVWSFEVGSFKKEFDSIDIPVEIVEKKNIYHNPQIIRKLKRYDLAIVNTILCHEIADVAKNIIPTIWYIREARNLPGQFFMSDIGRYYALKRAEKIYTVSAYAQEFIRDNYNPHVRVIHNCVEDEFFKFSGERQIQDRNIRFLALGTIEERKAFDVFIHAYMMMDESRKRKSEVHFAGRLMEYAKNYYVSILKEIENYEGIYYHGEIQDRKKLLQLIMDSDVVVVPSKDESCSLVVLEAAMMGKPVIISMNIGAKYVVDKKNGWIFQTDNIEELKKIYEDIIDNSDKLNIMGIESRKKYLETSTFERYETEILKMVEDNITSNKFNYRISHLINRILEPRQRKIEMKSKDKSFLYQFPYVESVQGKDVVLYAAGEVGQAFYKQMKKGNEWCNIVLWVDKNNLKYQKEGLDVVEVNKIHSAKFDYILIAVLNKSVFDDVKKDLMKHYKINEDKLKWISPVKWRI